MKIFHKQLNEYENPPEIRDEPISDSDIHPDISISYPQGEFGEQFLEAYNKAVEENYDNNKVLKVFEFNDNIVKGSCVYSSILAADILRQSGMKLAKPADIESAREMHESDPETGFDTKDYYVDYGLVFRSTDDPNKYLAQQLEPQIKKALGKMPEDPVVILSGDLTLISDSDAEHGLGLALRGDAKPFPVPILKKDTKFKETDENGMPIPDEYGNRTSYTIASGLSRLGLGGYLVLLSDWYDFTYSLSDGRVVFVKKK